MKTQTDYSKKVKEAQDALDNKLEAYYKRNSDGGCTDEIYKIAFSVSNQYSIDINYLIF